MRLTQPSGPQLASHPKHYTFPEEQMTEDQDALDKFGRFLMENLRDPCIEHFDLLAAGRWRAPGLRPLQRDLATLSLAERDIVRRSVTAGIDSAMHDFLFKLQELADFENDIQIMVDGKNVVPLSDGLHRRAVRPGRLARPVQQVR